MEHQKILNSLNEGNYSKFVAGKWNIVNDNSKSNYGAGNEIIYDQKIDSDIKRLRNKKINNRTR